MEIGKKCKIFILVDSVLRHTVLTKIKDFLQHFFC